MRQSDSEIEALWVSVFGEPPPIAATPRLLLEILVRYLPPAPPYGERPIAAMPQPEASEESD